MDQENDKNPSVQTSLFRAAEYVRMSTEHQQYSTQNQADKPAEIKGVTPEQMARMEREMANLQSQQKLIEDSYAEDVLNLVLAQAYLAKLLANEAVKRFIGQESPEICEQLELIVAMTSLDQ